MDTRDNPVEGFGKSLLFNPMFHLILALLALFTVAEFIRGDSVVRVGVEAARAGVFAVLSAMTFTAAVASLRNGARTGPEQMSISTFVLSFIILCHATYVPLSRLKKLPEWLTELPVVSLLILFITFAGIGYIVPITKGRPIDMPLIGSWYGLFFAGVIAGVIATVIFMSGVVLDF